MKKTIILFTLIMLSEIQICFSQIQLYSVIVGDTVILSVNGANGTIQWQQSTDSLAWADIPGATTNPQTIISTTSGTGKRFYRAEITNTSICNSSWYSNVIRHRILSSTTQVVTGDWFRKGIVFHTYGNGNGLIAPEQDQSSIITWGCFGTSTNATSTTDGATNTDLIGAACTKRPIAASICDSLTLNGYNDWYLPAKDQLNNLYQQKNIVGGFANANYWSSTENDPSYAWLQVFLTGYQGYFNKEDSNDVHPYNVRCIRSFSPADNLLHTSSETSVTDQPVTVNISTHPVAQNKCLGSSVTFAVAASGTAPCTFQWIKDSVEIPNATDSVFTKNNLTATDEGIYTCEVSNLCRSISSNSAELKVILLNADAGTDNYICYGQNTQLNGTIGTNHPELGSLNFTWYPTNTLINENSLMPTATPLNSTSYSLIVTDSNNCSISGQVLVDVTNLTAEAGSDKSIICGGTTQLDSITSNYTGTGILTYNWSPAAGLNNDTISNPTASVISDSKFYVTVTTPNGCTATDSVIVYVDSLTANAGMNKTIICGATTPLDNVTSNYTGTGTLHYNWSPTIGLNNDTISNPTVNIISDATYYVTVSTPNGCSAIDSINVYVNPLTISGTDININCGDSMMLSTTNNFTGSGSLTYVWSPSVGLGDTTTANPYATGISNMQYSVTVTTPNGCEASDNVNVSLSPMNNPEVCIVGVDTTNSNLVVWNKPLSLAIDSFYIYRETTNTNVYEKIGAVSYDSLSVFADTNSFPHVQSNKYKISTFDKCGIESAQSDYHKTMHLAINQGMGSTWNLDWETYEGFTVTSYRIYRGTSPDTLQQIGTTSGGSNQYTDLTPPVGYIYYQVEVVSPNSCNPDKSYNTSRSNIATNNPSSIFDNDVVNDLFSIYPNPANVNIEISVSQKSTQVAIDIEILNTTGQILKKIHMKESHTIIDISEFANGMYFIKMKSDKGVAVKRFVKE